MTEAPDQIDQHAPVIARQDILVNAPLERLWDIHTTVRGWRAWQSEITTLQSSAERLAAGVTFDWSTSGIDIHTTVYRVNEASHETLWGGPAQGITAIHRWRFTAEVGGTRVRTEESWDGEAIRQDVPSMQRALDASLVAWLERLKARAESAAPT